MEVVGVTDLEFDIPVVPEVAEDHLTPSTPLQRAGQRLQQVLPPGWEVDVVDPPRRPGQIPAAVLRVRASYDQ
ncbi:hypothetical protein ABIA39_002711 [Nocardia sp. GAS34]